MQVAIRIMHRQIQPHYQPRFAGVTLLELMLMLVVGATIVVLGLSQYLMYRKDADTQDLKNNINIVFEAAARYYIANCRPLVSPGALAPTVTTNPVPVLLSTLRTGGYLDSNLPKKNPLVNSATADQDYIVQFNRNASDRTACMTTNCATTQRMGTIVTWKIQVSVNIVNASQAAKYKTLLVADCISSLSGSTVAVCVPTPTASTYLVFERLPSSAETTETRSILAPSMPGVRLQNQGYNSAAPNYLLNIDHSTESQYFYCNG